MLRNLTNTQHPKGRVKDTDVAVDLWLRHYEHRQDFFFVYKDGTISNIRVGGLALLGAGRLRF